MDFSTDTKTAIRCFHCGDKCINTKIVVAEKNFCCEGCKMVYEILNQSGMCDYYDLNNKEMNKYRTAYKRRKNGFFDDEFLETDIPITTEQLLLGMDFHKNYRDVSMILAAAAYMLNILDANVSAHLLQFNVNDDLSVAPNFIFDPEMTGLRLAIKFN